jgi:hypothetical protein
LRRKRFLIEPLELPPESETGQGRSQDGSDSSTSKKTKVAGTSGVAVSRVKDVTGELGAMSLEGVGCSAGVSKGNSKLDF